MGDRNWAAVGNLLLKNRHNRSIGAQNISKTGGNYLGGCPFRNSCNIHFCDSFGSPHHIRWIYRLICGDHDQMVHLIFGGNIHHIFCSQNIINDRCFWNGLCHKNMLVCRSMKHHIDGKGIKTLFQGSFISYVLKVVVK